MTTTPPPHRKLLIGVLAAAASLALIPAAAHGATVKRSGAAIVYTAAPGEINPPALDARDVDEALRLRPELAALQASLAASEAQARSSGWRWAPSLSAFGTASSAET